VIALHRAQTAGHDHPPATSPPIDQRLPGWPHPRSMPIACHSRNQIATFQQRYLTGRPATGGRCQEAGAQGRPGAELREGGAVNHLALPTTMDDILQQVKPGFGTIV
jgi:hypothetical protein